jgi:hypothetical protein
MSMDSYAKKVPFFKQIHLAHAGTGDGSHQSQPLPLVDGDLMTIPAGLVIEKVYLIIDTLLTGTTDIDVGDDDDADGYIDGSLSVTVGTVGMYGWDAKLAGAYLRVSTAGATDAGDIYVVPNAKFYAASGKELKIDVTGTSTAGKCRVVVEGHLVGTVA